MSGWVISWGDHAWTDDDVLAGDAATVQALTEGTWVECDPWRGPIELLAYLATFIARAEQQPVTDVLEVLKTLPLAQVQETIRRRS